MKKILCGMVLSCWAALLFAEALELKNNHPDSYVVKKGDTLWDISGMFLTQPWRWPEIWENNPQISNPHLIYPGDQLSLIQGKDGVKLTVSERGSVKVESGSMGLNKNSGGNLTPRVRTEELNSAIPAIPLEKISAFLTKSRVVALEDLENAPYVLVAEGHRLVSGAGDKIFVRGKYNNEVKTYGVFRKGETYQDPTTREILGIQAVDIGSGRIISIDKEKDIGTLMINSSNEEIRANDRLLPVAEAKVDSIFNPKSPNEKIKGEIINVEGGVSQVGALDIVAINVGERNSLEVGDVLAIFQAGEIVNDRIREDTVQLPDTRAGVLIVFRTFEKMSFGFVLSANQAIRIGDKVANP